MSQPDISMARPHRNESISDFDKRLRILRSHSVQTVKGFPPNQISPEIELVHIYQYDEFSPRSFIRNGSGHLQMTERLKTHLFVDLIIFWKGKI